MGNQSDRSASGPAIRTLGDQIGDLKNDVTPLLNQLDGLTVTPGSADFEDANKLKTTVEQRGKEVAGYLRAVGGKLDDTKQKLHKNAGQVEGTESENASTANWEK